MSQKTKKRKPAKVRSNIPVFTKEQEAEMFKDLAHMTYKDVAIKHGIMKEDNPGAYRLILGNVVKRVTKAPDLYEISTDAVEVVKTALGMRSIKNNPQRATLIEREVNEFKDKLEVLRDETADLLEKKLRSLKKNSAELSSVKVKELSDVLSTLIDKNRLIQGDSTENIVKYSKLDLKDVTPEQSLQLILKAREALLK